ncbi:MAG: porin family protein [Mariprofundus sp.]|nr:porin family protein [Mariprofundus sp.]
MNRYITTLWMLFFMQGAMVAHADDFITYVSVGGGQVVTEYAEAGLAGGVSMKKSTWGATIKAGVDIYKYTGIEVRTGITGKVNHNFPAGTLGSIPPLAMAVQVNNFVSYFAKLQFPINDQFKVYGLLGATSGRISVERNQGVGGALKGWKTALSYGAGLEYKFYSKGSIGLEWVQYWKNVALPAIPPSTSSKASFSGASLMVNQFF